MLTLEGPGEPLKFGFGSVRVGARPSPTQLGTHPGVLGVGLNSLLPS